MTIDYQRMRNPVTKNTLRLRKIIILLPLIAIVEMEISLVSFWVGFLRKIIVQIREAHKVNFLIPPYLTVMLLSSKTIRSKMIKI